MPPLARGLVHTERLRIDLFVCAADLAQVPAAAVEDENAPHWLGSGAAAGVTAGVCMHVVFRLHGESSLF